MLALEVMQLHPSVLSVSTLTFELSDLWPWPFAYVYIYSSQIIIFCIRSGYVSLCCGLLASDADLLYCRTVWWLSVQRIDTGKNTSRRCCTNRVDLLLVLWHCFHLILLYIRLVCLLVLWLMISFVEKTSLSTSFVFTLMLIRKYMNIFSIVLS